MYLVWKCLTRKLEEKGIVKQLEEIITVRGRHYFAEIKFLSVVNLRATQRVVINPLYLRVVKWKTTGVLKSNEMSPQSITTGYLVL